MTASNRPQDLVVESSSSHPPSSAFVKARVAKDPERRVPFKNHCARVWAIEFMPGVLHIADGGNVSPKHLTAAAQFDDPALPSRRPRPRRSKTDMRAKQINRDGEVLRFLI